MASEKSINQKGAFKEGKFPIVGIGASAGGLKALEAFFDALPEDSGMAFVVIVHLSPDHPSSMAEVLQQHTSMKVMQVKKKTKMKPDHVYVIPPRKQLVVTGGHLELTEPVKISDGRSTIDLFLRSLAAEAKDRAVAVVLSGTGSDGALGLKAIKEDGGAAMAQDPGEAQHGGMPRTAIGTGVVDMVLPVQDLARKLVEYKQNLSQIKVKVEDVEDDKLTKDQETLVKNILKQVVSQTGHDFAHYKISSVLRRIKRRLQVTRLDNLPDYLDYMEHNPDEANELFNDLLISVTSFFRDEEAFKALEQKVIAKFLENNGEKEELRIWVPGCATGEEAYSIAMLLHEHASQAENPPTIQIFATDIDKKALGIAREGVYHESVVVDLGSDRFERYFFKDKYGYRIKKEIRDMVLFTVHDLLRDPPFTRLDLITCRNLLIYLKREMQSEVFNLFHYALHSRGFLFLGLSDSNLEATELFSVEDKIHQVYRQNQHHEKKLRLPNIPLSQNIDESRAASWKSERRVKTDFGELHRRLLTRQYAPASVIIDKNYDVIHSEGDIGKYLKYKTGEPSRNLLGMAVPEIHRELRSILYQFSRGVNKQTIRQRAHNYDGSGTIELVVQPVKAANFPEEFLQVIFRNIEQPKKKPEVNGEGQNQTEPDVEDDMVRELEQELEFTKEQLQVNIEEYETSNEELRASNEELQSMNEELQSTTEELETSKEELQSVNEELNTVNRELESKVEKLHRANDDLKNLMETTEVGIVFVDNNLMLKLHTDSATELFNIIDSDSGRPLPHITHRLEYENLVADVQTVIETLKPLEKMVRSITGRWYILRMRPYRTRENEPGGVVISFVDITEVKKTEEKLTVRARQQEAVLRLGLYMLNSRNMQRVFDKTVLMLQKELDMEHCRLMELNAEDETLMVKASTGLEREADNQFTMSVEDNGEVHYALWTKEPVVTEDYSEEDRFEQPPAFAKLGIKSGVNVMIEGVDSAFGVLSVYSKTPRAFSENEITFIRVVANALGGSIKREQINRSLHDEIKQSRELQRQIIKISNAKRWEVGQYLHDNLSQTVIAARLNTSFLASRIKEMDAEMGREAEKVEQFLDEIAESIRELSHGMIPVDVETGGLEYALEHFSDNMHNLYDIECEFNLDVSEELVQNRHAASDLLSIIQEATKNAVRHGDATKIIINMAVEEDQFQLTIEDNGTGLDKGYHKKEGMGTNIMRHRAQLMGGSLNLKRVTEEGGTLVTCLIPLENLQNEE